MRLKDHMVSSIRMLAVLTIITGVFYPVLMTVIAQLIFPGKSEGSLIRRNDEIVGSELIGQNFQNDKYFWGRPSSIGCDPIPSGASNLGPTSKSLSDSVKERRKRFIEKNVLPPDANVPIGMLFASGSGVDPHISPDAAYLQVDRVARARGFGDQKKIILKTLVENHIEALQFGLLGEPRVNVLKLNLSLDGIK